MCIESVSQKSNTFYDTAHKQGYRCMYNTSPNPHVSLHGPDSLSAICLFRANSYIVNIDRRSGPSRPAKPRE